MCKCNCCNKNPNITLTEESIIFQGVKLYRIVAAKDFNSVKSGTYGGYVESLYNIQNEAWIANNAKVFGNARVINNAVIKNEAIVRDSAVVSKRATILDNAIIKDKAKVFGWATISEHAIISYSGQVSEHAHIGGTAEIRGLVFRDTILIEDEFIDETMMLPCLRVA